MTKQEQIKEMARMMCGYCNREEQCFIADYALCDKFNAKNCRYKDKAKMLYDTGYRKIPEKAVVLTKEECKHKVILDEDHFERALNYERENVRKETAKAILNVLYFNLQNSMKGNLANSNDYYNVMDRIQKIAENYGVEVEK